MLDKKTIRRYISPLCTIPTPLTATGQIETEIQCVLFDIYGTLFISGSGDIGIAKRETRNKKTLEILFHKYHINKSVDVVLAELFSSIERSHAVLIKKGIDYPEIEIDRIWSEILGNDDLETVRDFASEFELIVNPVYPMPNLKKTLTALRSKKKVLGIISNAQFFTPEMFVWFFGSRPEALGFQPELLLYSYRHGYAKPSGFLFELAAQKLLARKIRTDRVLYVGNDMRNDIYPAKMAGMKTALFAGDQRSLRLRETEENCRHLSADIIITDLVQLLDHM